MPAGSLIHGTANSYVSLVSLSSILQTIHAHLMSLKRVSAIIFPIRQPMVSYSPVLSLVSLSVLIGPTFLRGDRHR